MSDVYDREIELLTEQTKTNPEAIYNSWMRADPLFSFCGKKPANSEYGCLTQVRVGWRNAGTLKLTAAIKADQRLPDTPDLINVEHLPVFAAWQRRIDKELGRTLPQE